MLLERVKCLHSSFSGKPCFFEFILSHTPSTNHLATRLCVAVIGCRTMNALLTFHGQYLTTTEKLPHSRCLRQTCVTATIRAVFKRMVPELVMCLWQAKTPPQLCLLPCCWCSRSIPSHQHDGTWRNRNQHWLATLTVLVLPTSDCWNSDTETSTPRQVRF